MEIIVDVDIASALAALEDLEDELRDLAESIETVDAMGTEGISIRTNLDGADAELAALQAKIEAFEAANSVDINTDFDRGRFTIPNFQRGGTRADNVGDLFSFMDFPGGGDGGRDGLFRQLRRQAGELTDTFEDFDLRMSDMHNMMARLVPLLLVFIGTIPAAITALVGLAAAAVAAAASLAAIGGLGALGVGLQDGQFDSQRLADVWEDIQDDFIAAFAPLAERLEPLFMDAVDGLGRFFQAIANEGDALMALTDEARAFGGFLMDFVPGALRTLAGLVEALSPLFAAFGNWLDQNFNSIIRDLSSLTMQAAPAIADLIIRLGQAVPWLVEMSIGFTAVANKIIEILGYAGRFLKFLGIGGRLFGVVTASVLTFASAVALTNVVMGTFIGSTVVGAISTLWGFWASVVAASSSIRGFALNAIRMGISSIYSFISSVLAGETALLSFSTASLTAAGAATALMTILTLGAFVGIAAVAMSAASEFFGLAEGIDSATSSLKEFDRVSGKTGDGFAGSDNPYGFDPENPGGRGQSPGGVTVFNVESSGDHSEDRSNMEYADWVSGRTTGG